jgi:hypothetical protein
MPGAVSKEALGYLVREEIGGYADGTLASYHLAKALAGDAPDPGLEEMLNSGGSLSLTDRAYLALALYLSGDVAPARAWYDANVKPNLRELTGLAGDTALYYDAGALGPTGDATAAASLLATALRTDEAPGLARWLAEKGTRYEPYLLEQIFYLTNFAQTGADSASFSYRRDGGTITETLNAAFKSVSFTREQLQNADFKVLSGDVYADVYYAGAPDGAMDASQKLIGFTKTVEPVGAGYAPGELVRITLTPDLSALDTNIGETLLVVDDYIPTGMRFERYDHEYYYENTDPGWYLNSRQGQRLQFTVYGASYRGIRPLVYYARCSTPGEYVVESAYVTSANGGTWGASERATVRIG